MDFFKALSGLFPDNENRLSFIAGKFGLAHQMNKLKEEMGELNQALDSYKHDEQDRGRVLEEMADVSILIAQLLLLFVYSDERINHSVENDFYDQVVNKIDRTIKRINIGYYDDEARRKAENKRRLDEIIEKGNK